MSNVTDISEKQPHITITGKDAVHVLPMSVLVDVAQRKKDITQIDQWSDFLPEIINDYINMLESSE